MKKYDNFCRALHNLQEGITCEEPYSIVEQTGIVALFEICFEQAWKLMKELLEWHGRFERKTGSPRLIIKEAYQSGLIADEEIWLQILDERNVLAHHYSDEESLEMIRNVKASYLKCFEDLKKEIDERWR